MWLRLSCLIFLITVAVPGYARTDFVAEWRKQVAIRLNSNKGFTPAPGVSGTVKVGFVLDRAGNLVSSWLAETTGIPALDEGALAIVDRAQPFPIPPPEVTDGHLRLIAPFVFSQTPPPGYRSFSQEEAAINAKMRSICRGC